MVRLGLCLFGYALVLTRVVVHVICSNDIATWLFLAHSCLGIAFSFAYSHWHKKHALLIIFFQVGYIPMVE